MSSWLTKLILLGSVILAVPAFAGGQSQDDEICANLSSAETGTLVDYTPDELKVWLQSAVDKTQNESFPELAGRKISVRPKVMPEDYYFSVSVEHGRLQGSREDRHYYVNYNPALSQRSPSHAALMGILVHELQHIADIDGRSRVGNVIRVLPQVFSLHNYERQTDRNAITRGAGEGLIRYRCWLYSFLTEGQLKRKKKRYLSPSEITAFMLKSD